METVSCPPDALAFALHALCSVEPLSATTMFQPVTGVAPFVTTTFTQYPVCHCDWTSITADIAASPLRSPSSDAISSPS
ncbi:hypothetical protein BE15_27975 [Sorangium cellulosum]|uniref:Uncharacterized protein n=1 Tax=Sorangium cellulosum TaxID=56 RepID=A0A150PZC1_SORCE|nr:hypothetical protein BE15_27975 [Sorangium cellulosum]